VVWLAQEVLISDQGLQVSYRLLRLRRDIAWSELGVIERSPGEVALRLRGARTVICAGPGLMEERRARLMRQWISRYAISRGIPVAPRARR
jgi:hypothetical protein